MVRGPTAALGVILWVKGLRTFPVIIRVKQKSEDVPADNLDLLLLYRVSRTTRSVLVLLGFGSFCRF